jgi:hypothetical protein
MVATPEIILIELNELCPAFMQDFMDRGLIPNFARFYESSHVFTTDAAEEPPHLEPWIQWLSVHSGMTYTEHGAFHLGEGRNLKDKCVAQLLSDAGVPVGVFSSMNTNYRQLNGYFIPDPWDIEGATSPAWLEPFYRTVANQIQESSKEDGFTKLDMARFGFFMMRHGLTYSSVKAIARQLLDEKRDPGVQWRRASLLEHVQYDLFRRLNRRFGVRFATVFCNSTAHYQHYYWRNMQPEEFQTPLSETDHPSLRDAIRFGYESMDQMVGRLMDDNPGATLMLCTALSQQPWDTTKCTFRPRDFMALIEFAGIPQKSVEVKPVMAEQFHLIFAADTDAQQAEQRLQELSVDGEPLMLVERKDNGVFIGCKITDTRVTDKLVVRKSDGAKRRFGDLFYMIHSARSGRHHGDGILWIRSDGKHEVHEEKVSLTQIAPTVMKHFGVEPPSHMRGECLPLSEATQPLGAR